MSTYERHVDYATAYFPYPTPTKIEGEPTYKSLHTLQKELRANASSIDSDLGGGDHGYLGLVLNDPNYAAIPGTLPFVAPNYPPVLAIPETANHVEALQLREDNLEARRKYLECKNVEKSLLRFLQDALEARFIEPLVDEYTNLLQ